MYKYNTGVFLDCYRMITNKAVDEVAKIGAKYIQMYAAMKLDDGTPVFPEGKYWLDLKAHLDEHDIKLSSVCVDICKDFSSVEEHDFIVSHSKRCLDVAKEMGAEIVTAHIGAIPEDKNCDKYKLMLSTFKEVVDYCESLDIVYGIETGGEKAAVLKGFLDDVGSKNAGANIDPANLVMFAHDDPIKAIETLGDYIVHAHAKDGFVLPEYAPNEDGEFWKETLVGEGAVDYPKFLKALENIGYRGIIIAERECSDNPCRDMKYCYDRLYEFIQNN